MTQRTVEQAMAWIRSRAMQPGELMSLGSQAEVRERARAVARAFETNPDALQALLEMTFFQPPVNYTLPRDGRFESFALVREGQNQVMAAILTLIEIDGQIRRSEHELSQSDVAAAGGHDGPAGYGSDGLYVG